MGEHKDTIRAKLTSAQDHVDRGEDLLRRQRSFIVQLEVSGHPVDAARLVLTTFEGLQKSFVPDRDRLAAELDASG
jgi:hypothetical protein